MLNLKYFIVIGPFYGNKNDNYLIISNYLLKFKLRFFYINLIYYFIIFIIFINNKKLLFS